MTQGEKKADCEDRADSEDRFDKNEAWFDESWEEHEARMSRLWTKDLSELAYRKQDRIESLEDYATNMKGARELIRTERDFAYRNLADITATEAALEETHVALIRPTSPPEELVHAVVEFNTKLVEQIRRRPDDMHLLQPRQFEELMAEILASFGWRVELSPATRDGGYDIYALSKDRTGLEVPWLVECKKYRPDRPIGVEIVRSFWAVKTDLRVPNGLIATTSRFTSGAQRFKESRYDLAFQDFKAIVDWLNRYRPHSSGRLYLEDQRLKVGHLP